MNLSRAIMLATILACTGCATKVSTMATGGSKADAIVHMSYEYGQYQTPIVDWDATQREATRVCRGWGYWWAEPLGGGASECTYRNAYGCARRVVTYPYQCQV